MYRRGGEDCGGLGWRHEEFGEGGVAVGGEQGVERLQGAGVALGAGVDLAEQIVGRVAEADAAVGVEGAEHDGGFLGGQALVELDAAVVVGLVEPEVAGGDAGGEDDLDGVARGVEQGVQGLVELGVGQRLVGGVDDVLEVIEQDEGGVGPPPRLPRHRGGRRAGGEVGEQGAEFAGGGGVGVAVDGVQGLRLGGR